MRAFLVLFFIVLLVNLAWVQEAKHDAVAPVLRINTKAKAGMAGWRDGRDWMKQHKDINAVGKLRKPELVFLGDSISQSWGGPGRQVWGPGQSIWDRFYGARNAAGFGISGDRTQHVLWRIENGNFDSFKPKVIVLMLGTNNTPHNEVDEIVEGISLIVKRLRDKLPDTKIILHGIFPRGKTKDDPYRKKVDAVNDKIKALHDGEKIHFMNINGKFLNVDESARTDLMTKDYVHLTAKGYEVWAMAIENQVSNFLDEDIVKRAALVKPHPRQVAWQEMEYTCFIHFGPNTFSNREWGTGKEDPNVFQPTALDTDQWAQAAKDAGMKLMLLTVKHHDGFCLWQTKYESHGVRSTSWRDGKGDVLRDLSESCKKYGLKLGVYLSPADLYQIENEKGLYGNGSKKTPRVIPTLVKGWPAPKTVAEFRHELDDYNAYFMNQLYELLTEYGPVHEVWFDGAHPKRKGGQTYDYALWYNLIRTLAPEAVIAVKGPDVRWIGNEAGHARTSEWSVIPLQEDPSNFKWPDLQGGDLGSRAKIKNAKFFHWHPAEMNTSIRPGWFYHKNQDNRVKPLESLLNMYYTGIGGNAVFLLNIPPDQRGLFHENDVARLKELAAEINATFDKNLAAQAKVTASKEVKGHGADKILDDDTRSFWSPGVGNTVAELEFDLGEEKTFNRAMLQEAITEGQRIESFVLNGKRDGDWKEIARGTTVGYKKLMRFPVTKARQVRVRITQSRLNPTLANFGLFRAPVMVTNPHIQRDKNGMVKIYCKPDGPEIRYTIEDGPDKTATYKIYDKEFPLSGGGTVTAMAYDSAQNMASEIVEKVFDVSKAKWKIVFASSEQPSHGEGKEKAIDGDPNTIWHSRWTPDKPKHPHEIQIDLGETLLLKGFTYLPRQADHLTGAIVHYEFYVSSAGKSWGDPAAKGEFANIKNNPVDQVVTFEKAIEGRFIRLVGLDEVNDKPYTSAAEIGVITR